LFALPRAPFRIAFADFDNLPVWKFALCASTELKIIGGVLNW
jgi:hypothetical protein